MLRFRSLNQYNYQQLVYCYQKDTVLFLFDSHIDLSTANKVGFIEYLMTACVAREKNKQTNKHKTSKIPAISHINAQFWSDLRQN